MSRGAVRFRRPRESCRKCGTHTAPDCSPASSDDRLAPTCYRERRVEVKVCSHPVGDDMHSGGTALSAAVGIRERLSGFPDASVCRFPLHCFVKSLLEERRCGSGRLSSRGAQIEGQNITGPSKWRTSFAAAGVQLEQRGQKPSCSHEAREPGGPFYCLSLC